MLLLRKGDSHTNTVISAINCDEKNNVAEYVLISPDEYVQIMDELNDARLLAAAVERMQSFDPAALISQEEVDRQFGFTEDALNALPEVEFE